MRDLNSVDYATEWTAQQCADYWRVQLKTWHGYVARGQAPKPLRHFYEKPLWLADEVQAWKRPGQGARTDRVHVQGTIRGQDRPDLMREAPYIAELLQQEAAEHEGVRAALLSRASERFAAEDGITRRDAELAAAVIRPLVDSWANAERAMADLRLMVGLIDNAEHTHVEVPPGINDVGVPMYRVRKTRPGR